MKRKINNDLEKVVIYNTTLLLRVFVLRTFFITLYIGCLDYPFFSLYFPILLDTFYFFLFSVDLYFCSTLPCILFFFLLSFLRMDSYCIWKMDSFSIISNFPLFISIFPVILLVSPSIHQLCYIPH